MSRVLLVDDDANVRHIVGRILEGMGYEVQKAASGAEALEALAREVPDTLVLDLLMPGPNGLVVLEQLRQTGVADRVPILVITGSVTPEADIRESGARGVLRKPFTAAQLRGAMKALALRGTVTHEPRARSGWFQKPRRPYVLIVEDDPETSQMLKTLLGLEGCSTATAANGVDALASMRARKPTVVVLDLMLPVMDGWRFREEQLKEPALADVPVVCIAPVGDPGPVSARLGLPCFTQPLDVEGLLRAVRECC